MLCDRILTCIDGSAPSRRWRYSGPTQMLPARSTDTKIGFFRFSNACTGGRFSVQIHLESQPGLRREAPHYAVGCKYALPPLEKHFATLDRFKRNFRDYALQFSHSR